MAANQAPDHEALPEIDPQNPPFPLNDTDKKVLAIKDEDWEPITWTQLREIIATNTLEKLQRSPVSTRQYLAWSASIKSQYGSTLTYITSQKLRWKPSPHSDPPEFPSQSPTPFANRQDYAILPNDWPYSFTPDITHLLVWTKTPIATDDSEGGDVTAESRRLIDGFVQKTFAAGLGEGGGERVLWFKNWTGLQSVRALDHVHVLVRGVDEEVLGAWLERRDL
ncbi:hypothetical protein LTR29_017760 [Friedmanniomyces endolithicus]|nr:hypothetical protein LTR29_017760 [Friedmanniomyces endolithicus]